ncbi:MAG: tRNA (adenosine(37)-N6)-threonylcarbamoyltransferase complex transferase subunit TsaD [Chloroflexi bacterium]|nr:tRNA (adenosine(37)-N6)-threonylcarbamoyltransferase complex transferase subunit TsaD [Chloroflexota bacterium]
MAETRILAIETSCDETSCAVVEDGRRIMSNVVASQVDLHARYGGVFPELASRAHIEAIVPVIERAMWEAHVGFEDLDAVAVTYGPGLAGSLLVGVNAAKGLALGRDLPLVAVNHLEAHVYAHWLESDSEGAATTPEVSIEDKVGFPMLALIVSGGHTELILMRDHGIYEYLGGTLDDAAGEAFDKVGRLLGLSYPGGPAIQRAAESGDPESFSFPRAWLEDSFDFSFSGLKTAVMRAVDGYPGGLRGNLQANMAASFQEAVVDVLSTKAARAAEEFGAQAIILCGGVSANRALRSRTVERSAVPVYYPPLSLCTDNAAMVGACAYRHFEAGDCASWGLDVIPGLRLA